MATTPDMDTARIGRTMTVLDYDEAKPKIKRFLEERVDRPDAEPLMPTDWRNTRIRDIYSAGTHQQSALFSVPLITTASGEDD